MATSFKKLTPNIMVEDIDRTIAFYKETLGFELLATAPEQGPFDWAMLRRDEVDVMFQTRASLEGELPVLKQKEIGGALTLYIAVENIKELYACLQGNVTVLQDMHTTFYGAQEFAIQDCNGFVLTFAENV